MRHEITVLYPRPCMTCEETIHKGERALWVPDVGIWHVGCEEPRNLQTYIAEAQHKKKLGL